FINAGVDAYNSAQEYLYLVSDLLRFKPDLVVAYDGWNDSNITDFDKNLSPLRREAPKALTSSRSLPGSIGLVAGNLRYSLIKGNYRLGTLELLWRVARKLSPDIETANSPSFDLRVVEYYRLNRRAFIALVDNQLSVALFLQPLVGTDDRELSDE